MQYKWGFFSRLHLHLAECAFSVWRIELRQLCASVPAAFPTTPSSSFVRKVLSCPLPGPKWRMAVLKIVFGHRLVLPTFEPHINGSTSRMFFFSSFIGAWQGICETLPWNSLITNQHSDLWIDSSVFSIQLFWSKPLLTEILVSCARISVGNCFHFP